MKNKAFKAVMYWVAILGMMASGAVLAAEATEMTVVGAQCTLNMYWLSVLVVAVLAIVIGLGVCTIVTLFGELGIGIIIGIVAVLFSAAMLATRAIPTHDYNCKTLLTNDKEMYLVESVIPNFPAHGERIKMIRDSDGSLTTVGKSEERSQ